MPLLFVLTAFAQVPPDATCRVASGPVNGVGVGDVDGNGREALLIATPATLAVWDLATCQATEHALDTAIRDLVVADLDGDGIDDVVLVRVGAVDFLRGAAGGLQASPWASLVHDRVPVVHALGDLDGDGDDELLVDDAVWLGGVDGPREGPTLPTDAFPSQPEVAAALGDLDGDGYGDAAIAGHPQGSGWYGADVPLHLMRGGPGGLAATPWWTVQPGGFSGGGICGAQVAVLDIDDDDTPEVAVACIAFADAELSPKVKVVTDLDQPTPRQAEAGGFGLFLDAWGMTALPGDDGDALVWFGHDPDTPWPGSAPNTLRAAPWHDDGLALLDPPGQTWAVAEDQVVVHSLAADLAGDALPDLVALGRDGRDTVASVWFRGTPLTGILTDTARPTADTGGAPEASPPSSKADAPAGGCGCTAVRSGAVGAPWALLALLGLRRRRPTGA